MKTRSLRKLAWVFFALSLTTTTVFAQGWRKGNKIQNTQNLPCITQISNLSEEQVASIEKLEASHQEQMDELRTERRSTTDAVEKSEIRTKMLKSVEAHKKEVKALLNEEQQNQYDQLQANGNGRYQKYTPARGNRGTGFQGNSSSGKQRNACRANASGQGYGQNNRNWNQGRNANCIRNSNN